MRSVARLAMVVLTLFSLYACYPASDTFHVQVLDGRAVTAKLRLCGKEESLRKDQNRFSAQRRTTCEGDGEILVSFLDRQPVTCVVGYVTPGLSQTFSFIVRDGRCQAEQT